MLLSQCCSDEEIILGRPGLSSGASLVIPAKPVASVLPIGEPQQSDQHSQSTNIKPDLSISLGPVLIQGISGVCIYGFLWPETMAIMFITELVASAQRAAFLKVAVRL